ncbi:MAG: tetraacyldisaccharide 4'-kinase [Bacteroidales bacterium]|jgi:tetraacyldisaccharide 4'-kinase|nr:tetraacyldisaccharide 4'-kinase [Bacteroidales bacterium]
MYGLATYIRNIFFDKGILKTMSHKTPIVSVGNLKAGGTGKTPFVEHLLTELSSLFNIAVVSRGYGRKTKGFLVVESNGSADMFGDEPLQMARKFNNVLFCVCEKRNTAIEIIEKQYPEINLIVLDDAYQHRYTARDINILLTEYNRPFFSDKVIPFGLLREYRQGYKRANYIVVTKCPPLDEVSRKLFIEKLSPTSKQRVFFSHIVYKAPYHIDNKDNTIDLLKHNVVLFTGISNNSHIRKYIQTKTELLDTITFNDHHSFTQKDRIKIMNRYNRVRNKNTILLTTEKDASKLQNFHSELYVLPIENEVYLYPQSEQTIKTQIIKDLCTIKSNKQQNI